MGTAWPRTHGLRSDPPVPKGDISLQHRGAGPVTVTYERPDNRVTALLLTPNYLLFQNESAYLQ